MQENRGNFHDETMRATGLPHAARSRTILWVGVAVGLAVVGLMSAKPAAQPKRRYADRDQERRNPLHFFLAGRYPRRRHIDRSGTRPLFERRQSVYDSY
jgi:hypothetical protein